MTQRKLIRTLKLFGYKNIRLDRTDNAFWRHDDGILFGWDKAINKWKFKFDNHKFYISDGHKYKEIENFINLESLLVLYR